MRVKVPNPQEAVVPSRKLTEYLLSPAHRHGRGKARFFTTFGFTRDDWHELASALRRHAGEHEVSRAEETPFGTRYVVDGIMPMRDGRAAGVRSVWFIERGSSSPYLVTAYPLKRKKP